MLKELKGRIFLLFIPGREIVFILLIVKRSIEDIKSLRHTLAALKPSLPCSSASFSYPMGASSLYGPVLLVSLTSERTGMVVVSVAEGAILFDSMQYHLLSKF
jgi:hypothetical protein